MRILVGLLLAVALAACADTGTVRDAPVTAGVERSFNARYDAVTAATLDSIRSLNVNITSSEEKPEGLVVLVAKPAHAFSWGEVGRVTVVKTAAAPTPVKVYWEKRSRMQITGTGQTEFSDQLFAGIQAGLDRAK